MIYVTGNAILILSVIAWALAQLAKGIIQYIVDGVFTLEQFFASGGMPSSHSALVTCCATSTGLIYGFESGIFAIAALFAIVVMYDACHVRKSSGEQARMINELLRSLKELKPGVTHQELKVIMGHTTLQVLFGALLGFVVAMIGINSWI